MSDLLARLRIEAEAGGLVAEADRADRSLDRLRQGARRLDQEMVGASAGAGRLAIALDRTGDQAERFDRRMRSGASGAALMASIRPGASRASPWRMLS